MKQSLIYLASPYSHRLKSIRHRRWRQVTQIGAQLIAEGVHIFGPITESHSYSEANPKIGKGWEFWKTHYELMLSKCDELWVVMLDGWENSKGVQGEIAYATERGIPITYIKPEKYL